MAVVKDAASGSKTGAPATSLSWSHTCTGSDLLLLVAFSNSNGGLGGGTVTYNGVAMTPDPAGPFNGASSNMYYLIAPATGAHTVSISSLPSGDIQAVAFSCTGAQQTGTPYSIVEANAGSGTHSGSITTTADGLGVAFESSGNSISTPNKTDGSIQNNNAGSAVGNYACQSSPGTGGSINFTWADNGDQWYMILANVLASSGGAPTQDPNSAGTPPYPYVVESIGSAITTSRSPSVTFTATPAPGDWVVLFASSTTTGQTMTEPSGWTNPLGAGVDVESDAHQMACAYHQISAAESAAGTKTYTATNWYGANTTGYTHGHLIRSSDPTTLIDTAVSTFDSTNTVTPHVFAAITPAVQAGLILASVAKDGTGAYSSVPGGMTQLLASNTNQGRWSGYYSALGTKGTAVGPTNITPSAGDEYASIVLSIDPNYDAYHPPTPNPFGASPFLLQFLDDRYLGERNAGAAGPINYTIDLAGTITSSASLVKDDSKPLAGSGASSGAIAKLMTKPGLAGSVAGSGSETGQMNKGLAGTVTSSSSLARAISKALAGTITPAGALAKLISKPGLAGSIASSGGETNLPNKGLAGTVTSSGSETAAVSKGLAGAITSGGALSKLIAKAFDGTITSDGALSILRSILLALAGTITSSGSLVNQTGKGLDGSTSPSGAIGKSITKPGLAGSVASSGSETGTMNKGLAGSVSSSGSFVNSLSKALTGTVTSAASIVKFISKGLTGSETPAGSLDINSGNQISLSGTVSPEGSLANAVSKALTGSTSLSGAIAKLVSKGPTGSITPSGDLTTSSGTNLSLSGSVSPAGALSRAIDKALGGTITPSGSLTKLLARAFSGDISSSGAPSKQVQKGYSATITPAGAIVQLLGKGLSGTISGVGSLAKLVRKGLTGLLTSTGILTVVNPNAVTVVPGPFDAHWEICLDGPPTLFVPDQSFDLCLDEERWIVE